MTPESIGLAVRNFIAENFLFGEDGAALAADASFLENGVIDSTGILQLVAFLEERFQMEVSDEELIPENLDSIDNVVNYLQRKLPGLVQTAS
ncbi:MAG: acyl carrier protein [Deltaproteobacteria bacterium]|nr:acyl carrier protein [Deltaproteobacteria bacterium]